MKREIRCKHDLPISQCDECYPVFLAETTVGDVLDSDKTDGKSQAWRDAADTLIEALARENKFVVAPMVQIFLESAGYGLLDYSPLGGVFKRAAKKGIISRIDRQTKEALWYSHLYRPCATENRHIDHHLPISRQQPKLEKGSIIALKNFGEIDGDYRITNADSTCISLESVR